MNYCTLRSTAEETIATNWSTTLIQYENVPFTPPDDGWVSVRILPSTSEIDTLGQTGYDRYNGLVSLLIFTPSGAGSDRAINYGITLGSLFKRKSINGISFGAYTLRKMGCPYEGFYCVAVDIPFWFLG